jgi:microcystin-dependent protein
MGTPYLSEIKLFAFSFAPRGWALCNGQLLPINQNQALFSLLGTNYGGNGQTTFGLPDLRGRVPLHFGDSFNIGQAGGATAVTLSMGQLPTHTHFPSAKNVVGNANLPSGNVVLAQAVAVQQNGGTTAVNMYSNDSSFGKTLNPGAISTVGGSQAHNNMMPSLVLNFCIALQGIFPSRN